MNAPAKKTMTKMLLQMLFGALLGAGATAGLFALLGDGIDTGDGGTMIAMVAGISYVLMSLLVGFGLLAPRTGAHLLNVEDAQELRDDRRPLGLAAAACMLAGVFFLALALARPGDGGGAALWIAGAALAGLIALTVATRRTYDELTRQVNWESAALTLQVGLVVLAVWAALAHLGLVAWIEPLALIGSAALLQLAAIFWVAGRRGMLRPRGA